MKIQATRDAICMADDIRSDDKILNVEFEGENVKQLLEYILAKPNFLAFASDTRYKVFSNAIQIAKIENQILTLQPDAPLLTNSLEIKNDMVQLYFAIN